MKTNDYLKYIDLDIVQDDRMFRVNSDTTALGMSLDMMWGKSVLDIGTNNGALLLYAWKKKARRLIGVDIFPEALELAKENVSRYADEYAFYCSRVQDLDIEKCDVIVCNPPFFEMNNVSEDPYLKKAMFEESLPLKELLDACRRLLKDNGEVYLIYPADRFPELYEEIKNHRFKIMKMRFVHDENSEFALRVIVKLKIGKMSKLRVLSPVIIQNGGFTLK
ncbi:MAG: methyltransferase domain-containing protein [Erysipelotrichaceae bacterium]|nr:methyltransferase domain-containing protein [Erysipelotrichaceae bacterium]